MRQAQPLTLFRLVSQGLSSSSGSSPVHNKSFFQVGWTEDHDLLNKSFEFFQEWAAGVKCIQACSASIATCQHTACFQFVQLPLNRSEIGFIELRNFRRVSFVSGENEEKNPLTAD
jgi:hypothetical protein